MMKYFNVSLLSVSFTTPRTSSPLSEDSSATNSGDTGQDGRESPLSVSSVNFDERPRSFASVNVDEVGIFLALQRPYNKDLYRREGKGCRCCLGDRIASMPRRASYFASGRVEE